ncbi:WXG100 family type VII secretion target [Streptomyces sp. NBC_01525]|uniref:WXG100 family type VII secretion target n=1 Tax=Streptomyces benahoarensis TaxID=2595054 RepID=A0A553Z4V4_9ACTN|nr:WXG100 family type VII secretion target [Streptomyces benahoarensis]TSB18948.1 WXG100 family type VII secretion target [Streptomyces benahoarensis]TSB36429.1 WXG100 family type VII secretion target [Streptomyces benahoarensis]
MTGRGNPEALHEAAAGWREMGSHLDGMVRELDKHVGRAAAADWQGPAGEAFAADWHRLKRSVDETLPVFELAAADLESAASRPAAPEHEGEAKDAPAPAAPVGNSSDGGRDLMYGVMALGQLGNALGGFARGKGGGSGGQGSRPPLKGEWAVSDAPAGPDPFGPGGPRRGGAGIAKGARTPDGAAAASGTGGPKNAAPAGKGSGGPDAAAAPSAAPAPAAAPDAKPSGGTDPAGGTTPAGGVRPDVGRHGAFG